MTQYKKVKVVFFALMGTVFVSSASANPAPIEPFDYVRSLFFGSEDSVSMDQLSVGKQWDCKIAKFGESHYSETVKEFRFLFVNTETGKRPLDLDVDPRVDAGAVWHNSLSGLESVESDDASCKPPSRKDMTYRKRVLRMIYANQGFVIEKMVSKAGSCGPFIDPANAASLKALGLPTAISDDGYYAEKYQFCQLHKDGNQ